MMQKLRPYLTAFRVRALLETQYRGAALGGLVTQMFFGMVYAYLYSALYAGRDPAGLQATITYVWLQQMFFRALFMSDGELQQQIMTGSLAYTLCRPVDQHLYWISRNLAAQTVGALMRALPMLLVQFLLPADIRMSLPASPLALAQFTISLVLGIFCVSQIQAIGLACVMKTLDHRGLSSMLSLLLMTFSGNVVPLTLFPDSFQQLIRYQPFAQVLDAPIRMYLEGQPMGDWLINLVIQLMWIAALMALGRWMWARQLRNVTVQGG
ncbi:MAG: ABC-2 family transporter protein [Clostridia bacterium]|nr:ABC-2 family transporter protein [Clostridia bacterium]